MLLERARLETEKQAKQGELEIEAMLFRSSELSLSELKWLRQTWEMMYQIWAAKASYKQATKQLQTLTSRTYAKYGHNKNSR